MTTTDFWSEIHNGLSGLGYELKNKLSSNRGNVNSEVWLAEYKNGEAQPEERALKISSVLMRRKGADNDALKLDELTQREVDIQRRLNHPHIPAFRDFHQLRVGGIVDVSVLATAYVHAQNLQTNVDAGTRITDEKQVKTILEGVLSALDHVHTDLEQPVLHRDIKPSNILYDGQKAWLFDFNFSQVGQKTVSFTIIDNYGYYPADAYSGTQTASQDLCALGNVAVALAHGKDIAAVRNKQGKAGLEPVDVEDLPYSPKMKRFLKKMTTPNMALRYQTAEQALEDLKNLDKLTEEALEQKLTTVVRGKTLTRLLERLSKEDPLVEYNIPPNIRATYDDEALLEHLKRTYHREEFVIEDPNWINHYVGIGDRVIKKRTYSGETFKLNKGQEGIITKVEKGRTTVRFGKIEFSVDPIDLEITGRKKIFGKEEYNPPHRADQLGGDFPLQENMIARYTGENRTEYRGKEVIPDGAKGLVLWKFDSGSFPLRIVWENRPGLKQVISCYHSQNNYNTTYLLPESSFSSAAVKLVKPNQLNFDQLYRECSTVEEQKK